ncbi:hypothetical protein LSTR_LSTR001981 [Laodelphax striatellus]|uniref:Uncharacterized protein n=1 Tax=Laodelphax striatellus TaxID=195883 RepID=A0A482XHL5_LAOST|nr:hypothetical protein LSTR_LSTR001981 [Laodelphax striatellus]
MYSLSAVSFFVAAAMLCMLSSQVRAEKTELDTQESALHHRQERSLLNGLLCDVSRLCVNLDVKANVNLCCKCNKGTYIKIKNECHRKMASCLLSSLSNTLSGLTPDLPVVDGKHCS